MDAARIIRLISIEGIVDEIDDPSDPLRFGSVRWPLSTVIKTASETSTA